MRRFSRAGILLGSLLALSCTDQPTSPPSEPSHAWLSEGPAPSVAQLDQQVNQLFPSGPARVFAHGQVGRLQSLRNQNKLPSAQSAMIGLVDFTLARFKLGALLDPDGPTTTQQGVVTFACGLFSFVQLNCGNFSTEALGPNGAAQVVGTAGGDVVSPDLHIGVRVPSAALSTPGLIIIRRLPDPVVPRTGPLPTSLDQYLAFYDYSVAPSAPGAPNADPFATPVIAGICQLPVGSGPFAPPTQAVADRLQLAHPDHANPSTIELLPQVDAPFLDCSNFSLSSLDLRHPLDLARAGWNALGRAMLPSQLLAAITTTGGVGGTTRNFSPFGAVDPVPPGSPDLVTQSFSLDQTGPIFRGNPISFTVTVRNAGNGPAGASTLFFSLGQDQATQTFRIPALAGGATTVHTFLATAQPAGSYQASSTADSNGEVSESDETNNSATFNYTVSPSPAP